MFQFGKGVKKLEMKIYYKTMLDHHMYSYLHH